VLDRVQILIPMTGSGTRFKAAGYKPLKPFISVLGRPMLEWVVRLFPGDEDHIHFICRKEHLHHSEAILPELNRIASEATILEIEHFQKKGPVYDILQVIDQLNQDDPVIVSYCDYFLHWDYLAFKSELESRRCEGAIPCYTGFHPHLVLDENLYASCRVDAGENLLEIREKFSWTQDKTQTRHSPGLYYFCSAALMKQCFEALVLSGASLNGEFYVSLAYNTMVELGLKAWCPTNVPYFFQWGTPLDLSEFLFWNNLMEVFQR
jgi:NDP-sugar pyrophosphorylase family protein